MSNNFDVNIFIENEYPDFQNGEELDCAKLTQDAVSMTKYFLQNHEWVKGSCLNGENFSLLYFDVVFCDNEKIREINREYRQKDVPTDVITFAIFADSPKEEKFIFDGEINLGEVIISLDKTLEQSKDNSHHKNTFKSELYFLLAHGILHLLGFDHQDEETLQKMWEIQHEMIEGAKVND